MQSEINIKVGNKPPKDYFELIDAQISDGNNSVSGISTHQELSENLQANSVPSEITQMDFDNYSEFLMSRRKLMAAKMRDYYFSL